MPTHTHIKVYFLKRNLAITVRALPWLSPILTCMLAGITALGAS